LKKSQFLSTPIVTLPSLMTVLSNISNKHEK